MIHKRRLIFKVDAFSIGCFFKLCFIWHLLWNGRVAKIVSDALFYIASVDDFLILIIFSSALSIWMAFCIHELMQHASSSYSFEKICSHKLHICIDSCLHELLQHVLSYDSFEKIYSHKLHIQMAYFHHELLQHVDSRSPFENSCSHRWHIWMAFFLHEQRQHVCSSHSFENSSSHKCHIWLAFFPLWTEAICVFILLFGEHL